MFQNSLKVPFLLELLIQQKISKNSQQLHQHPIITGNSRWKSTFVITILTIEMCNKPRSCLIKGMVNVKLFGKAQGIRPHKALL